MDLPLSRPFNGMFTVVDKLNKWVKLIPMVVEEGEAIHVNCSTFVFQPCCA